MFCCICTPLTNINFLITVEESEEEEYDNLSIDHPECWNTPRQDPNPPSMRLYFTKGNFCLPVKVENVLNRYTRYY